MISLTLQLAPQSKQGSGAVAQAGIPPKSHETTRMERRASAEMVLDKDHAFPTLKRHGGRKVPTGDSTVKTAAPRLSIVMLVCGTRGDVQPFIALGLKMKARFWPVEPLGPGGN